MAGTYLGPILLCLAFIMIIGSLSSTADSICRHSSIVMADVYGQSRGRGKANPRTMLLIGRVTMIIATAAALYFATARFSILDLLVFVGAMWGCLVFPVIASFYWKKITNAAFTTSVLAALAVFLPVRFEWIPVDGIWGYGVEALSIIGIGVILGIMGFGFFGMRPALIIAVVGMVAALPYSFNYLRDYSVLTGSGGLRGQLLVCYLMSLGQRKTTTTSSRRSPGISSGSTKQPAQTPLENIAPQKQGEYYDRWTHLLCLMWPVGRRVHVCDCSGFFKGRAGAVARTHYYLTQFGNTRSVGSRYGCATGRVLLLVVKTGCKVSVRVGRRPCVETGGLIQIGLVLGKQPETHKHPNQNLPHRWHYAVGTATPTARRWHSLWLCRR